MRMWEVEMNSAPHFRVSRGLFGPGLRHMMASWTPGTSVTRCGELESLFGSTSRTSPTLPPPQEFYSSGLLQKMTLQKRTQQHQVKLDRARDVSFHTRVTLSGVHFCIVMLHSVSGWICFLQSNFIKVLYLLFRARVLFLPNPRDCQLKHSGHSLIPAPALTTVTSYQELSRHLTWFRESPRSDQLQISCV